MNFLATHIFQLVPHSPHLPSSTVKRGEILCDVCFMLNLWSQGSVNLKQACCQNQFYISQKGAMHYHNTSSATKALNS